MTAGINSAHRNRNALIMISAPIGIKSLGTRLIVVKTIVIVTIIIILIII
jgi:hypothetical protein